MAEPFVHADLGSPVYVAWRQFLRDSEDWTREQVADYQLREIKRMVAHAYQSTRGYKALYDQAGLRPDSIRTLDDLRRFPFVEKEMIRDHLEDFSVPMEGRTYITTGGSTGIPTGMYRDPHVLMKELASKAYQYYRVGWKEGDRQLVFRGLPIETPDHTEFFPEFNELRCSSYHLVPEWMEVYRQKAIEYQPEWLRCFPSSGFVFGQYIKETRQAFPKLKGILCASENVYDFQRRLLSEVFQTRVYSHYGQYELAVLAGYCEYEDVYHVLPQYGYAELIDQEGRLVSQPGQIGEIVGTSFIMHATPFIRYRTQDLAVFKSWGCSSCGRPYQLWERIEGRLQELIITRTGRYISTSMLNMHDEFYDHVKQFQFHQREPGEVYFRFIPKDTFNEHIAADMMARLTIKLGNDVRLEMDQVKEIPLTPRGKHRLLVQELKLKYYDDSLTQSLTL